MKNAENIHGDSPRQDFDALNSNEHEKKDYLRGFGKRILSFFNNYPRGENQVGLAKAKEKGYHYDKRARVWYGSDKEPVPGFRLDMEYPEVADRFEESVEKYFGDKGQFHDFFMSDNGKGTKEKLYENIQLASLVKEEDWGNLFYIMKTFGGLNYPTSSQASVLPLEMRGRCNFYNDFMNNMADNEDAFLTELNKNSRRAKKLKQIIGTVGKVSGKDQNELYANISAILMDFCPDDEKESVTVIESAADFIHNKPIGHYESMGLLRGLYEVATSPNPGLMGDFLELYQPLRDLSPEEQEKEFVWHDGVPQFVKSERTISEFKNNLLEWYAGKFQKNTKKAFEKIFELIDAGDNEVSGLNVEYKRRSGDDEIGTVDYIIECFASDTDPASIDRLVRLRSQIPATDSAKHEQNRRDAIALDSGGGPLSNHEFIHQEFPGIHSVVSAMVDFYDAPEDARDTARAKLQELVERYGKTMLTDNVFNLPAYNNRCPIIKAGYGESGKFESAIDILRRIEKNTDPTPAVAPTTKNEALNQAMNAIHINFNKETGVRTVSISEVGRAAEEMNKMLMENAGQVGVLPSIVDAVIFLDGLAADAIRSMDSKEWREAAFDPAFKEIVRFSELTSSTGKHQEKFDDFYNGVLHEASKGFGGDVVDNEPIQDGYKIISKRILENVGGLAKIYSEDKDMKQYVGALWSGNLAYELVKLADPSRVTGRERVAV